MKLPNRFSNPQSMAIIFNDNVYAIDNSKNMHFYDVFKGIWGIKSWIEWKP